MVEVELTGKPLEQRIADRLKNWGDEKHADIVTKHGYSRISPTLAIQTTANLTEASPTSTAIGEAERQARANIHLANLREMEQPLSMPRQDRSHRSNYRSWRRFQLS